VVAQLFQLKEHTCSLQAFAPVTLLPSYLVSEPMGLAEGLAYDPGDRASGREGSPESSDPARVPASGRIGRWLVTQRRLCFLSLARQWPHGLLTWNMYHRVTPVGGSAVCLPVGQDCTQARPSSKEHSCPGNLAWQTNLSVSVLPPAPQYCGASRHVHPGHQPPCCSPSHGARMVQGLGSVGWRLRC
jgi:hypothetical protein